MVREFVEPEAWTLPSPRKNCESGPQSDEKQQPSLCQPQTAEVLREDRFSSPKRNFRSSTGRQWQREMFALRAELEATKEMMSCRFSGERTDFASLQSKISSLKSCSVPRTSPRTPRARCERADVPKYWESSQASPRGECNGGSASPTVEAVLRTPSPAKSRTPSPAKSRKKPSPADETVLTARMQEPKNNGSSPPRRRSPSPNVCPLSVRGLPHAHASLRLNAECDMNRFCGICGVWYKLGDLPHQCYQCDLADPLCESNYNLSAADVEKQVEERVEYFERVQRIMLTRNPSSRSTMPSVLATAPGVRRMKPCELPILNLSALDHSGQYIKSPEKLEEINLEEGMQGIAANDHTPARGAELRNFGNEIDALTADLIALEDEIHVACP